MMFDVRIGVAAFVFALISLFGESLVFGNLTLDTSLGACRIALEHSGRYCSVESFEWISCLTCYLFIPNHVIPKKKKLSKCTNSKFLNCTNIELCSPTDLGNGEFVYTNRLESKDYNASDPNSLIYDTFESETDKKRWRECCANAVSCCRSMLEKAPNNKTGYCPRTWDGWQCFDDTLAGDSFETFCPPYAYQRSEIPPCPVTFKRQCEIDGNWSRFPNTLNEWTNYSSCPANPVIARRHYTHVAAYGISLLALLPAIVIFFAYKQLSVPRITMHKNLFISIFFNGIVLIIFKKVTIISTFESLGGRSLEDSDWCKLLFVLTKYFRITNYMWMFCEGFYLHKLIVAAFAEQKTLIVYYLLGWGFPMVPVIIYSILRVTNVDANTNCWLSSVPTYEWVVFGPCLASLMINVVFLCNIIRVLVMKLRATHTNEPSQYRKAVRATLVLVPLFGLHFVLTIYKPTSGRCEWQEAYYYIHYLMDGLQGLLVAVIFCYNNGEILSLLRRTFTQYKLQKKLDRNSRQLRDTYRQSVTTFENT